MVHCGQGYPSGPDKHDQKSGAATPGPANQRIMDEAKIRQHIAEAEAHIARAESRITRQKEIIAECAARGRSTEEAENLLAFLIDARKAILQMRQQSLPKPGD